MDTTQFDEAHDRARAAGTEETAEFAAVLATARAGFASDPPLWLMRLRLVLSDIAKLPASPQLTADAETAVHEILEYARAGAADDPTRLDLLTTLLNSHALDLEQAGRIDESRVLAEEQLALVQALAASSAPGPNAESMLAHSRSHTAELRLRTGDAAGAFELADALVDTARLNGEDPSAGPSGLPSWLRLRARSLAALGDGVRARADFEAALEWERARLRAGRFLAHLDLAEALDGYAELLQSLGDGAGAQAATVQAQRVRTEKTA